MTTQLIPYKGGAKKIVVYDTYAQTANQKIHFDVFIPTDKTDIKEVPAEYDQKALEYAKDFLKLIGKPDDDFKITMCSRCHMDNTDQYKGKLWQLSGRDAYIWPIEGCPKPNQ